MISDALIAGGMVMLVAAAWLVSPAVGLAVTGAALIGAGILAWWAGK